MNPFLRQCGTRCRKAAGRIIRSLLCASVGILVHPALSPAAGLFAPDTDGYASGICGVQPGERLELPDVLPGGPDSSTQRMKPQLVPDGFKERRLRSEREFVLEWARENGWDEAGGMLDTYLRQEKSVRDPKLGSFRLCRIANAVQPGGGEQTIVLLHRSKRGLSLFSPLVTQYPPTNQYEQKLTGKTVRLVNAERPPGRILWVEISEKIRETLDEGVAFRTKESLLAYAFAVEGGALRCIAFKVPLKLSVTVSGRPGRSPGEPAERTALRVRFPRRGCMRIQKQTPAVTAEQQKWIGEFSTGN